MYGIILNIIEATLMKYLVSIFGPQAWKHALRKSNIEKTPKVEKTFSKYPL